MYCTLRYPMCYLECNQEEFCLAFAAIGATCYRCMADSTDGVPVPQANQSQYRIWTEHLDHITRT